MCIKDVTESLIINFSVPGPATSANGLSFELPNSILRGKLHRWRIVKLFTTATGLNQSALVSLSTLTPDTYIYDATTLATGVIPYKQGVAVHVVPQTLEMVDAPTPWYDIGSTSQQCNLKIQVGNFSSGIFIPGSIAAGNGNYTLEIQFASLVPKHPMLTYHTCPDQAPPAKRNYGEAF